MKDLISYLESKKMSFTTIDDEFIEIAGKKYFLVKPNDDGALFVNNFILVTDEKRCDRYVYKFGGKWYWDDKGDENDPKMNDLLYLGDICSAFRTPSFLGVHGGYEILNGSRMYEDWAKKAKFLGCESLGICDKNTLAGVLKFQLACQKYKIKPVIGASYSVLRESEDFHYDIKLFVKDEKGWENLLLINKEVNVNNVHQRNISESVLFTLLEGLVVVIDPKTMPFDKLFPWDFSLGNFYYQLDPVEFNNNDRDKNYLLNLKSFVRSKFKPVSISDAYYLEPEDSHIKTILNNISGVKDFESSDQYFKSMEDYMGCVEKLFNPNDESYFDIVYVATLNESEIVRNCNFSVSLGKRFLPKYEMTLKEELEYGTNEDLFWDIIEKGLRKKISPEKYDHYIERLNTEFNVIQKGDVIDYFLILWDIIKFARDNGILVGIGRGSAGGSIISYLMDIIQLDPIEFDLLFERFLNEGRIVKSLPDIDTDFPGDKRNRIKVYMEEKYGATQVCSVGTYTALQVKSSIKDIGRVKGLNFAEINQITTMIPNTKSLVELFQFAMKRDRVKSFVKNNTDLINDIKLSLHQPKAKSIHACAMLILPKEKDMFRWLPVVDIDGQMVSEWEGPELEAAGFLKEDILGVRQLDKFENIIKLIKSSKGVDIDIYKIPLDDKEVYKYFSKGWNGDVFHFGSRGLTGYCKQLQPDNIEDLIAGISLYRPGAMENNFHNEYILRKEGKREVEYFTGAEEILNKTYGVFVYQEQIMKLCQVLGGLSLVEADDVRKAMVKKKYEELTKYKDRFIPYYYQQFGVSKEYSEAVWETIDKASTYLFNRSHATAYAITGYVSQWLKVHYPVEFWSTAFQFASEDDYAMYISEIELTGKIKIMSADINNSHDKVFTDFNTKTIYWPFLSVKQCGEKASESIMEERGTNGVFFSFEEFLVRMSKKGSKVTKQVIENLIFAGAFDQMEGVRKFYDRYKLFEHLWDFKKIKPDERDKPFEGVNEKIYEDWWWCLKQKQVSGISFFDYSSILDKYLKSDLPVLEAEMFQDDYLAKKRTSVQVGGYITEVEEYIREKGDWCKVKIENNYNFLWVVIRAEQYGQVKSHYNLINHKKDILLVTGDLSYSTFQEENVVTLTEDSELFILY